MNAETKTLLIEVAKTVLRVLDPAHGSAGLPTKQPTPWGTALNEQTSHGTLRPLDVPKVIEVTTSLHGQVVARDPHHVVKGDVVRFWDGDKYVVGTVISLCRNKSGTLKNTLPRANVRVEKSSGRGKTHQVEVSKCSIVKGVKP